MNTQELKLKCAELAVSLCKVCGGMYDYPEIFGQVLYSVAPELCELKEGNNQSGDYS